MQLLSPRFKGHSHRHYLPRFKWNLLRIVRPFELVGHVWWLKRNVLRIPQTKSNPPKIGGFEPSPHTDACWCEGNRRMCHKWQCGCNNYYLLLMWLWNCPVMATATPHMKGHAFMQNYSQIHTSTTFCVTLEWFNKGTSHLHINRQLS